MAAKSNDVPAASPDRALPIGEAGVDGGAFLDHLGSAIRLNTVVHEDRERNSQDDILAFHEFLRSTYPAVHDVCDLTVVDELSLLYRWRGSDAEAAPIVLMAHMDVVPIEPGTETDWQVDAFSGVIVDDHLWGRGALDDKGPLIAMVEAVEHLITAGFSPRRTVMLAFGHDEGIGGTRGAKVIARLLRSEGVAPWIVVDEGGAVLDALPGLTTDPVALIKVAEKGYVNVELTATGVGGHSSLPPVSTAIGTLSKAIAALEENPLPARVSVLEPFFAALDPILDPKLRAALTNLRITSPVVTRVFAKRPQTDALMRTSTAVTMVSGGVKPNVLPQEAKAVVNFRILPGDTIQSVLDHVTEVVGQHITVEPVGEMRAEPSGFSSTESDAWAVVKASVEETFPEAIVAPWILPGATDSRYFADFAGDVYGFGPFTMDLAEGGIHGTDERIRTSDAERAVSFFCRLIRNAG